MAISRFVRDYFDRYPSLELWALGSAIHRAQVDLEVFGVQARYVAAESAPDLVRAYLHFNRQAFVGDLALPGWVLTDLYLMPGIVGLLVCPASEVEPRWPLDPFDGGKVIIASYFCAPSLTPKLFVGASLISAVPRLRAGPMIKALTLRMNRATRVRGISAWADRPIRSHVKVGPLHLVSATPGPHESAARSFVYETPVDDDHILRESLAGELRLPITERVPVGDTGGLVELLARVRSGERLAIVPPGVDDAGRVCLTRFIT